MTCDRDLPTGANNFEFATPEAVTRAGEIDRAGLKRRGALPTITVTGRRNDNKGTATINVKHGPLGPGGITLNLTVTCNDEHMCRQHGEKFDCVPVTLHVRPGRENFQLVCLRPTLELNTWDIKVEFTLDQLAKLAGAATSVDAIQAALPGGLAVEASWLAAQGQIGDKNGQNHSSGGYGLKGGSGVVRLAPLTEAALKASEKVFSTEWTLGEKMSNLRPVFQKFPTLLQADRPMSTNLEAESEYQLASTEELDTLLAKARSFCGGSLDDVRRRLMLVEVTEEPMMETVDTYYDFTPALGADHVLLRNALVLRRRSVPKTDPADTFLLAAKGRTLAENGEVIRYAGQARLVASQAEDLAQLTTFVLDTTVDNVVARVLRDALEKAHALAAAEASTTLVKALTIKSTRYKFSFTLANQLKIELSVDYARGFQGDHEDRAVHLFCFEFGVGHPGLGGLVTQGASTSATASTVGKPDLSPQMPASERLNLENAAKYVTRPYHVPSDLNARLFAKDDHKSFRLLRDVVITEVFGLDPKALLRGGNKAQAVAQGLKLI
ncbi:hypothetical protein [Amycolatopsis sp. lyj-23]|uniref:hypothetical protein n=1 Tax=Amycolatopsis sp. lyj-23 TaxID=2789283 RepID=UPI0039787AF2